MPLTQLLKRPSTIPACASFQVPQINKRSTAPRNSIGLAVENCRGRLWLCIDGNGDDWTLPRRARDPVGPPTVGAGPVRVSGFRRRRHSLSSGIRNAAASPAFLKYRVARSGWAMTSPVSMASGRETDAKKPCSGSIAGLKSCPTPLTYQRFRQNACPTRVMDCSWI
jgi:hypothetical protein